MNEHTCHMCRVEFRTNPHIIVRSARGPYIQTVRNSELPGLLPETRVFCTAACAVQLLNEDAEDIQAARASLAVGDEDADRLIVRPSRGEEWQDEGIVERMDVEDVMREFFDSPNSFDAGGEA